MMARLRGRGRAGLLLLLPCVSPSGAVGRGQLLHSAKVVSGCHMHVWIGCFSGHDAHSIAGFTRVGLARRRTGRQLRHHRPQSGPDQTTGGKSPSLRLALCAARAAAHRCSCFPRGLRHERASRHGRWRFFHQLEACAWPALPEHRPTVAGKASDDTGGCTLSLSVPASWPVSARHRRCIGEARFARADRSSSCRVFASPMTYVHHVLFVARPVLVQLLHPSGSP
jgi:hypothetical protein